MQLTVLDNNKPLDQLSRETFNLNPDTYFSVEADRLYMSVSQFKRWVPDYGGCEAAEKARQEGFQLPEDEQESEALLIGKYMHAWNEGKEAFERFKSENSHLLEQKNGKPRAFVTKANSAIATAEKDKRFMFALEGQKEVIFSAPLTFEFQPEHKGDEPEILNVWFRCMVDSLKSFAFTDLKYMASLVDDLYNKDRSCWQSFIEFRGYDLQMGLYAEIIKQANGAENYLEPMIAGLSKQNYADKEVFCFSSDEEPIDFFVSMQLQKVKYYIRRVIAVKNGIEWAKRCERCDYCRYTKEIIRPKFYKLIGQ